MIIQYINITIANHLSKRDLQKRVINHEYERLLQKKAKLINKEKLQVSDLVSNPILIKNEIFDRAKDYTKKRNKVKVYFEIGKILSEAGKEYSKNIIIFFQDKNGPWRGPNCVGVIIKI